MTAKSFVDSNLLVYAHDSAAGRKHERAAQVLRELWASREGRVSTQVLQEFYVAITRKLKPSLPAATARELVRQYAAWVEVPTTAETVLRATEIAELASLSFRDALMLAAAEQTGASRVLTEDLNEGQVIAGMKIVNPLRTVTAS